MGGGEKSVCGVGVGVGRGGKARLQLRLYCHHKNRRYSDVNTCFRVFGLGFLWPRDSNRSNGQVRKGGSFKGFFGLPVEGDVGTTSWYQQVFITC